MLESVESGASMDTHDDYEEKITTKNQGEKFFINSSIRKIIKLAKSHKYYKIIGDKDVNGKYMEKLQGKGSK